MAAPLPETEPGLPEWEARIDRASRFGFSLANLNPTRSLQTENQAQAPVHGSSSVQTSTIQRNGGKGKKEKKGSDSDEESSSTEYSSSSESEDDPSSDSDESFQDFLDTKGAKQQGEISTAMGKEYAGPISMVGKRSDQVTRHVTNLILNRLTHDQIKKAGDPKKAKKPIEVQMSSVGGKLLLSTNNPHASKSLFKKLKKVGGLQEYLEGKNALNPAMDKDKERPKRLKRKLDDMLEGERHWQVKKKRKLGEDDGDIEKAQTILKSVKAPNVELFDPDDEKKLKKQLELWKKNPSSPGTYVVLHGSEDLKTEHAERVQTKFRAKHLKPFENKLSTNPTGPKTTCLGCDSFHQANHPHLAYSSPYTGAYFEGSSPVTTEDEKKVALDRVKNRPSTGSISQHGYLRNSDYPDSDSDDEGGLVFPRPQGFTVPFDESNPKKLTWITKHGEQEFRSTLKSPGVKKQLEKQKQTTSKKKSKKKK